MIVLEDSRVESIKEIRLGIWSMWLQSPRICELASPGQFVHIRITGEFSPLLRRPLSIGRIDGSRLELVWRVVGKGTALLTEAGKGNLFSLLGPLGNPFTVPDGVEQAILVAGGLGLPPLVFLHQELNHRRIPARLLLGVTEEKAIPLADDDPIMESVDIIVEKGSGYRQGLVTDLAQEAIAETQASNLIARTVLYACGPWGLTGALQRLVPPGMLALTEVSLEQQMGCGIGVCQGCAIHADGGLTPYRLVCSDGPVFDLFSVEVPDGS